MSRICPFCGQGVRPQARFCPRCGKRLEGRLAPGAELDGGNYRIVQSISKGGMGAVYLAQDRRAFDRLCVIKQMLEYYDPSDPEERLRAEQRFEEEGRTLAGLSHPGVPKIYAFFSENGRFYIVMEHIEGKDLESFVTHQDDQGQTVAAKRLPQEEVVRYTIQACRILEYLHSQPRPVVHQDVKPANLILESQLGLVRLVDFGTAHTRAPHGASAQNGSGNNIYGTDGYAPPEQYRGNPEPQSDVFALAATAYHLLTDDDPRDHPFKWLRLSTLPRELALALERAFRTNPEQRSTARELREALEALATPKRTLEAFTFPGGDQIRSVGALPALCDEHWDAARSFLYNGDFSRWLGDINRLDLVVAADGIVEQHANHDAGLEAFLRQVDPGLPQPRMVADPSVVDLGGIARDAALIRNVTVFNDRRGYVLAQVSSSEPWIDVHPATLHLWAGRPVDIRIHVHAEDLPFRSQQRGVVAVEAEGLDPIDIPVTAQVSLVREAWRLARRAVAAAAPESWRTMVAGWRIVGRVASAIGRPFAGRRWLLWVVWLVLGVAIGAGAWRFPSQARTVAQALVGVALDAWPDHGLVASFVILGPPFIVSALWLSFLVIVLVGGGFFGAVKGAWRSFFA